MIFVILHLSMSCLSVCFFLFTVDSSMSMTVDSECVRMDVTHFVGFTFQFFIPLLICVCVCVCVCVSWYLSHIDVEYWQHQVFLMLRELRLEHCRCHKHCTDYLLWFAVTFGMASLINRYDTSRVRRIGNDEMFMIVSETCTLLTPLCMSCVLSVHWMPVLVSLWVKGNSSMVCCRFNGHVNVAVCIASFSVSLSLHLSICLSLSPPPPLCCLFCLSFSVCLTLSLHLSLCQLISILSCLSVQSPTFFPEPLPSFSCIGYG